MASQGFTYIELIIVIILLGILAAFAMPNVTPSDLTIEYEARRVLGDIRYAQALSITQGQQYRFVKTSATTYQILNQAGGALVMPMGGTSQTLTTGISFSAFSNLPNNLIAFGQDGTPYIDTSSTALGGTATITLSSGSGTRGIQILPQTGYGALI